MGHRRQADISAAIEIGVRAVLWRDALTLAAFIRGLLTISEGDGRFPPNLQGSLMEQVQWIQRKALISPRPDGVRGEPQELNALCKFRN